MSLPSTNPSENRDDLPLRLKALRQQVESSNPEHYRQLALYLQVLRRVLPGAVDQACFHLATHIAPDRYAALPGLKRQALHRRLDDLVRQSSSLLTVEQLASLATRLAEDKLRQHLKQRRRWIEEHGASAAVEETDAPGDPGNRRAAASGLPSGSVVLGLDLPLGELGGWFQNSMDPADFQPELDEEAAAGSSDDADGNHHGEDNDDRDEDEAGLDAEADFDPDAAVSFPWELGLPGAGRPRPAAGASETAALEQGGSPWPAPTSDPSGQGGAGFGIWDSLSPANSAQDPLAAADQQAAEAADTANATADDQLRLLRASFAAMVAAIAASEGIEGSSDQPDDSDDDGDNDDGDDEDDGDDDDDEDDEIPGRGLPPLPWRSGALPKDPALLLVWLEGFEQALSRRLRNLSHAINVEFLRQDLSATLLPPSLLDAVLAGRLDTQSAPANLLRLPLPLPASAAPQGLVGHALLLRCGDLEGDHPQLRTCRQRLLHLRQEVRKMAQLQTRLQQRLRTQEAERLWMQTVRRTRTDSP
ncbi:MAG: hypothetical protein ACK52U_06850 [Synechococcaceae cyanobacterium]